MNFWENNFDPLYREPIHWVTQNHELPQCRQSAAGDDKVGITTTSAFQWQITKMLRNLLQFLPWMHRFSAKRFSCEKKRIHRLYDSLVCRTMPFYIHSILGLYSLSGKTSYRQISWSLEAARLDVAMVISLWNLTATSAAVLPRYLPNFRAIGKV